MFSEPILLLGGQDVAPAGGCPAVLLPPVDDAEGSPHHDDAAREPSVFNLGHAYRKKRDFDNAAIEDVRELCGRCRDHDAAVHCWLLPTNRPCELVSARLTTFALFTGVVTALINTNLDSEALAYSLNIVGAQKLITGTGFEDAVHSAQALRRQYHMDPHSEGTRRKLAVVIGAEGGAAGGSRARRSPCTGGSPSARSSRAPRASAPPLGP